MDGTLTLRAMSRTCRACQLQVRRQQGRNYTLGTETRSGTGATLSPPLNSKTASKNPNIIERESSVQTNSTPRPHKSSPAASSAVRLIQDYDPLRAPTSSPPVAQTDYQHGLQLALRHKNLAQVFLRLKTAYQKDDHVFLSRVPGNTWSEILRLLSPRTNIVPLHDVHRGFSRRKLARLALGQTGGKHGVVRTLVDIVGVRREYGAAMGQADFRLLLHHAAAMGDEEAATAIMGDLRKDNIVPDLACHNYYMASLVWAESKRLDQAARSKHTFPRQRGQRNDIALLQSAELEGSNSRKSQSPVLSQRLKKQLQRMLTEGIEPDMDSYCLLINTLSREGRINEVETLLSETWQIDVTALDRNERTPDADETFEGKFPKTSPLFPNTRFLSSLVEAFGSMNRVPTALRLVDHISKLYKTNVKRNVWDQLLRWTWLQARFPLSSRSNKNVHTQLHMDIVARLVSVMLRDYPETKLTMETYDIMLKVALSLRNVGPRTNYDLIHQLMFAGRTLYITKQRQYRRIKEQCEAAAQLHRGGTIPVSLSSLKRRQEQVRTRLKMNQHMFHSWIRLILRRIPKTTDLTTNMEDIAHTQQNPSALAWMVRGMPDFIKQWGGYVPSLVEYELRSTGKFELRSPDAGFGVDDPRFRQELEDARKQEGSPTPPQSFWTRATMAESWQQKSA